MPPKQRKHIKIDTNSITTPENYPDAYDNIRIMRKDMSAPVDTMGCEKVKNSSDEPKVYPLPSLILQRDMNIHLQ